MPEGGEVRADRTARRGALRRAGIACVIACACACQASEQAPSTAAAPARETVRVGVGGEHFEVEVAADPLTRTVGLSGRSFIPPNGGMLFVLPSPRPMSMVMRDCPNPIDVAFADSLGRVVSIHSMRPEPPRADGETPYAYESRLPEYPSREPVQFALETAGGRLAEVGLRVGDRLHFAARELLARAHGR